MKDKSVKNKGGRPKKTVNSLPANWKQGIADLGMVGASKTEMQAYLDIGDELFEALQKRDKEFSGAIKHALRNSQVWWEKHGRTKLEEKGFSAVLWYMNMKNRFGWKDKIENEIKPAQEIAIKFTMPKKK